MFEKAKLIQSNHFEPYQVLNFLDIEVILHSNNTVKTVYTVLYMFKMYILQKHKCAWLSST